jgi:hypothetical protein
VRKGCGEEEKGLTLGVLAGVESVAAFGNGGLEIDGYECVDADTPAKINEEDHTTHEADRGDADEEGGDGTVPLLFIPVSTHPLQTPF